MSANICFFTIEMHNLSRKQYFNIGNGSPKRNLDWHTQFILYLLLNETHVASVIQLPRKTLFVYIGSEVWFSSINYVYSRGTAVQFLIKKKNEKKKHSYRFEFFFYCKTIPEIITKLHYYCVLSNRYSWLLLFFFLIRLI